MPIGKKERMREALVYHPSRDQLTRIARLHLKLSDIADSKASEEITPQEAIAQSVREIRRVSRTKNVNTANGPLQRLEKICANGWIREASAYMPQWYPDLTALERTMNTKKKS